MRFKSRITARLKNSILLEKITGSSPDLCFAAAQEMIIPTLIPTLISTLIPRALHPLIPHRSHGHTLEEIPAPSIWG